MSSFAVFMILCIQLSNFLEPLSLLFTDDITVAESPFTIRLDIYEAFAYIKLSNKAKISVLMANPILACLEKALNTIPE